MRKIPDEIAIAVSDWIDKNVPTPDGPPVVNATVKLEAVDSHLIGTMPDGSDGPTSGTRTHVIRIKFFAHPDTDAAAIDQLLGGLRLAAAEEPQIAGLNGGRFFLDGDEKVEAETQHEDSDHNGQIITVTGRVVVSEG
ncbi:MAG TPA: hypothetical protein VFY48_09070 [Solirubrobacterales bacterium]|nr:hypothetical protein [Solirubrobacterales bacterium]